LVLLGFGILGLMAWTGTVVGIAIWSETDPQSSVAYALPPAITSVLLFSTGLVVLHASGYRWVFVKPSTQSESSVDVFSQLDQPTTQCRYRRRNLLATLGIIGGSIVLSFSISTLKQERLSLAKTYVELNTKLNVDGGYLEYAGHQPIALKVANSATDKTVPDLSQLTGLSKISFSGSRVTEATLKSIATLTSLTDIDLSFTQLDDSAVKLLDRGGRSARLSLAGTRVTIKGINSVIERSRFYRLDIGELNIDDDSLAQLSVSRLHELVLKGNPITDKSIPHISTVKRLNLSDTKCVGTGLAQLTSTMSLVLDGTSVDDANIQQLLSSNKVLSHLSLRNTRVTDAILRTLQQTPSLTELEIGDGQITPEGLLAVAFSPPERLALNSKKFDANLFAEWHPSIRRLDMSGSGVSDANITNLKHVRGLTELSLAHCDVSDACLPTLVAIGASKIDLTGTKVTASAVAKHFPKTVAVYLSADQCQSEQLSAPDPAGSLRIGVRMTTESQFY
jgi:Leucine-rich repeat (LRR) protein